jgi:hypothetical protein
MSAVRLSVALVLLLAVIAVAGFQQDATGRVVSAGGDLTHDVWTVLSVEPADKPSPSHEPVRAATLPGGPHTQLSIRPEETPAPADGPPLARAE